LTCNKTHPGQLSLAIPQWEGAVIFMKSWNTRHTITWCSTEAGLLLKNKKWRSLLYSYRPT